MKRIIEESTIRALIQYLMELSVPKVPVSQVIQMVQALETLPKLKNTDEPD